MSSGTPFTTWQILVSNLNAVCIELGILFICHALNLGKGGIVQSIQFSMKTLIHTSLDSFAKGELPNNIQIMGLICGLAGVSLIAFWNKSK